MGFPAHEEALRGGSQADRAENTTNDESCTMILTHEVAQRMISTSQEKARELGMAISTAIVDTEGRLFAFGRMDGTHWLSIDAAQAKAFTGAILRQDGPALQQVPSAMISALSLMQARAVLPMGSITVLRDENDRVIAGIGCSGIGSTGATDVQDGECARAARDAGEPVRLTGDKAGST
ncbi:heme-binding protein [Acidisphaera sp. L21]|uniref:GlcG/HbpS family heme-binding protein n=1 Tax=Acidisphaera sp. L21 TaxID=1641851 RepID=UPI00131E0F2D|nr:heme-binding protein [Acidisphaera sp. L21]